MKLVFEKRIFSITRLYNLLVITMNKGKSEKKEESKDSLPKLPKIKQVGKPPIVNRPECVPEVKFDDELSDSKRGEFKMSGCVPLKNPVCLISKIFILVSFRIIIFRI